MTAESPFHRHAIAGVFNRAAATYDTVIPLFAAFGARLVDFVEPKSGERVLDVGCGRGATFLPAIGRVGPHGSVLGVDLADNMISRLAADIGDASTAAVQAMDAEDLQCADESFDIVVSGFTLHLLGHPDRAAKEFRRVLRAGGRCAASAPLVDGPNWDFLGRLIRAVTPRAGQQVALPFRPDFDLASVLRQAGFVDERLQDEEVEFVLRDEAQWWDWAWSNGLRAWLEALSPPALDDFRQEAFRELSRLRTAAGLPIRHRARFVIARKPSGATF